MWSTFEMNEKAWLWNDDDYETKDVTYPVVTKIVINVPATIVFWSDGTKTVVKCAKNETFDAEKGVAKAITKKFLPKQYGRKLTAMTDEAVVKCAEAKWKADSKLKKKQKKETEGKACWNCRYKSVSFWELPCKNCRSVPGRTKWVPAENEGR